jgi:hypothetical protein
MRVEDQPVLLYGGFVLFMLRRLTEDPDDNFLVFRFLGAIYMHEMIDGNHLVIHNEMGHLPDTFNFV